MREYQLGDRLWAVKLALFLALLIAAFYGLPWSIYLFALYVGALILHYIVTLGIGITENVRVAAESRQIRRRLQAMTRIERDAFERDLVRTIDEELPGGIVPAVGRLSFRAISVYGFASGPSMQRRMAASSVSPKMRLLGDTEKWRARLERRLPRDTDAIVSYWRMHDGET